ncbi:MAG: YtxH domain-containing protein [Gemmatimonadota bacterium]|nr:YtxH domain-containing protein [Gemmatimonadota bacterium]MDE2871240.1 YtxH domain-containing protein [Gemmatimonadota bacterium]
MSTGEDQHTVIIEKEKDRAPEIMAFLIGAVVGAGLALLFAPASGADTQKRIREQAKKLKDLTGDRVRELRDDLGSRVGSAGGVVEQGRQIAADARAELEDKLERSKAVYRAGIDAAREESRRQVADSGGNGSPADGS